MGDDIAEYKPDVADALARVALRQQGPRRHLMPVGLIGPREATGEQLRIAEGGARALAATGLV
ncbi:lysine decarboxylase, partial [Burkholderia mallei]|nr:lysine decarboxylase [Burkholderia mallei]